MRWGMRYDIAEFRRVRDLLTSREREILESRCQGMNVGQVAELRGIKAQSVSGCLNQAYEKLRELPDLEVYGANLLEAVCWRMGYEQAVADIEERDGPDQAA